MKILVINGDCIQTNTSANLCHLAYINGLVSAGHCVSVLSADARDYKVDLSMKLQEGVRHYTYYGVTLYEKLALRKNKSSSSVGYGPSPSSGKKRTGIRNKLIKQIKAAVLASYGVHGTYIKFVQKAKAFRSDEQYDYVLSLSTPVTSHLLAHELIRSKHIKCRHWIQIWEDPWYSDAYGFNHRKEVFKEEKRLLSFAEKVCYVSPITLENQKALFPESAHKMYWQPVPYYYKSDPLLKEQSDDKNIYGYFGAYYPAARNLKPFYQAAKKKGIETYICGDPSHLFAKTDKIHIYARLPLEELKPIEDRTDVLVFLCNRRGGQIPGKIYQYSATDKTILFILDGTEKEKKILRDFFAPYRRYVFCENTPEDIGKAIDRIEKGETEDIRNNPVDAFDPAGIIRGILKEI